MPRKPSPQTEEDRAAVARELPRFVAALYDLGPTRPARAEALGADVKTIDRLLIRLPESLAIFAAAPQLLRALADDLEDRKCE